MITFLFAIVLGMNRYMVVNNCTDLGGVYFPQDDSKGIRVLSICMDVDKDQREEVIQHELLHICMHDHKHSFTTKEELHKHLEEQEYKEEYFATIVAPCLIDSEAELYSALDKVGIQ